MTSTAWALLLVGGALLTLYAVWNYRARELKVAGIGALLALRASALVLLLLLLLNPLLPWGRGADVDAWTLVDLSLSMGADDGVPWTRAAPATAAAHVVGFGDFPRTLDPGSFASWEPTELTSHLEPAVRLAAEAGARSLSVISDLRLGDLTQALSEAGRLGLEVGFLDVGEGIRNAGVAEALFPEVAEEGGFDVSVSVFAEGLGRSDSVRVEIREEDRLVATAMAAAPGSEATTALQVRVPGPSAAGPLVRYTVHALIPEDAFADDDARVAYAFKEGEEGGLVLVSWSPDFELRVLLPALEVGTGLRATSFLRVGTDRFLASGAEGPGTRSFTEEQVQRRLAGAELAVLHGVGDARPPWLDEFMARAPRLLVLPATSDAITPLGVAASGPIAAEWLPETVIPASPIAAELSGLRVEALPPLMSALTVGSSPAWFPALSIRRDGRGSGEAALLLGGSDSRRRAVALAQGFHRWALRSGAPAEAYRRVWAGVGGWLVGGTTVARGDRVRPETSVVARGRPITWVAPGLAGDSIRVRIEGPTSFDTVLAVDESERALMMARPPGVQSFQAWRAGGADTTRLGEGRFDVERYTEEMRLPAQDPERLVAQQGTGTRVRMLGQQRLRTSELPYLLLIGLLAAEWIARRRRGLR